MKKLLTLAVCLVLLFCATGALAEVLPITKADIDQMCNTGMSTLQEYVDALKPTEYTWYFEGAATGATCFTLIVPGGSVSLQVLDAEDYQDDDQGLEGATSLSPEVLKLAASLCGASWESDAMGFVFMPREIKLGDSKEKVLSSIGELELTEMAVGEGEDDEELEVDPETDEAPGDDYDEVASCQLTLPEDPNQWHEYYGFDFFFKQGELEMAQYWYSTDPE